MSVYKVTRSTQSWYGEQIGILILDAAYPCVPGNVGNATTYDYPVRFQEVRGASIDRLLNQRDPALRDVFIEAAVELQNRGVKAITGACGFMAYFQEEVAAAVQIPVFLSSLMQIPFMHALCGGTVGIITANAGRLTARHFEASKVPPHIPLAIAGMESQSEFREAILDEKGTLDSDAIENEVTEVARRLVKEHPGIRSVLLECSDLPPYAHAIQATTGRPVFDFITMINYVQQSIARRPYVGSM
ncbi:aspartate/glutamate racemase family protein [Mesorhizobium sp. VK22B]|uniref:Aspartate/glutamate racemase family protein n=1 Tax=Mesorhizobium captivum TaxID=3072319 RepID=A0ABU4ZAN5_9HYPH|nr:aspartate/glutamate racemase family protein [Mesorhizobium sp. VK22B]MDX8496260.1 aspartate/glutamate racemase family protein [Mesorhizobium sp. VK22B]